jgi:DUF4097 and DUF4098 domain-containing protein YvlB
VEHAPGDLRLGELEVRYAATLPRSATLKLQNTKGRVTIAGVRGPATVSTTNGDISATDLGGPVDASTVNGDIELAFAVLSGPVSARATNGDLRILVPSGARASLLATATNGDVDVTALDIEDVQKSGRRLEATLNGGGPRVQLSTTNGRITIVRQ